MQSTRLTQQIQFIIEIDKLKRVLRQTLRLGKSAAQRQVRDLLYLGRPQDRSLSPLGDGAIAAFR